jgi:tetratricopeptide (TPR) repeat protein
MSRKSTRRRGFGIYLGSIRDSRRETQLAFAETLNVSRSVIGNIETGTPPSVPFLEGLEEFFRDKAAEIEAEALRHGEIPRNHSGRRRDYSTVQQRIEAQIAADELLAAKEALVQQLGRDTDTKQRLWVAERLSYVARLRDDRSAALINLICAIAVTRSAEPGNSSRVTALWEQVAMNHYSDDEADNALSALDLALRNDPTKPSPWYRKGLIHCDKGEWSNAYAALTTALKYKGTRCDIVYARSQVLLEWGYQKEAIVDLDEAMASPQFLPMNKICAESARVCAQFLGEEHERMRDRLQSDEPSEGSAVRVPHKLDDIETTAPRSPWPPYYRAICLMSLPIGLDTRHILARKRREKERACRSLEQALECDDPAFNPVKRKRVERLIQSLRNNENDAPISFPIHPKSDIIVKYREY